MRRAGGQRVRVLGGIVVLALAGSAHVTGTSSQRYTLRLGDTLAAVARRAGVSVQALARANDVADPDRVFAGRVLVIPPAGDVVAKPVAAKPAPAPAGPLSNAVLVVSSTRTHRVAAGQTLGAIARLYDTTVAEMVAANGLGNANLIRVGEDLAVPGPPWLCPVAGANRFSDGWGQPRPGGRRHLGVDIFAARGTPVVANVSGTVVHRSGAVAGNAYYLEGDDANTYYGAHLDSLGPAGRVARGTVIGTVGNTGNAQGTTPHLHFEIKPGGGDPVNPYPTLRTWC